jgi:putative nucleotidyltransferase with HDIG domain
VSADPLRIARETLPGERAWLVGGAVRDRLLGLSTADLDIVVDGDVAAAAKAVGRAGRGAAFALSEQFGAWRVSERRGRWQVDLTPLRGGSIEADLALRDFTVNAIAEPLDGGPLVDPLGGAADLRAGRLRIAGARAFADDPLRTLRLVRLECERSLVAEPATVELARHEASRLASVSGERVFGELRRLLVTPGVADGVRRMDELGVLRAVLPELSALQGVEQNRYHHRDVWGHTLEVLEATVALEADPGGVLGAEHADAIAAVLAEPLADGLCRGDALRLGALLHDIAKPLTIGYRPDGRVIFPGHDARGAEMSSAILARLRTSERLRSHVALLARHHLRLGFLVHRQPLSRRELFDYLRACEPVEVDVTLLSVADRLATRGDAAERATAAHLELARELLPDALRWHAEGPPAPVVRGDELARALGLTPGPELGRLLEELAAARFTGEADTRERAVAHARRLLCADRLP